MIFYVRNKPGYSQKQLTISYENNIYQMQTRRPLYAMRYAPVTVQKDIKGNIRITYKGTSLSYTIVKEQPKAEIVDSKQLNLVVDRITQSTGISISIAKTPWIPPRNHPWRRPFATI